MDIFIPILGGLISLLFGGIIDKFIKPFSPQLEKIRNKNPNSPLSKFLTLFLKFETNETGTYSDRIQKSLENLKKASTEIDTVMTEFSLISSERQKTIDVLEKKLQELTEKETNLTTKIQTLEKVPLEAMQHFEDILNKGDRRSAFRDYILFGLGVVVSVVATVILKALGF